MTVTRGFTGFAPEIVHEHKYIVLTTRTALRVPGISNKLFGKAASVRNITIY